MLTAASSHSSSRSPALLPSHRYPPRHSSQYRLSSSSPGHPIEALGPRRVRFQHSPDKRNTFASSSASQLIYHSSPKPQHRYPQGHQRHHHPPPIRIQAEQDYDFDEEPTMIYSTPNYPLPISHPSALSPSSQKALYAAPPSPPLNRPTHTPPTLPSLASGYTSVSPTSYDHRGRQQSYLENPFQRRERVEFIRRRENLRRVKAWVEELSESGLAEVEHVEDVHDKPDQRNNKPYIVGTPVSTRTVTQSQVIYHTTPSPSPSLSATTLPPAPTSANSWLDPEEPYIFYMSSNHPSRRPPSPASSSPSSMYSRSPSSSPPTSVGSLSPASRSPERGIAVGKGKANGIGVRERRKSGGFGSHSRQSSLESISEEGEGE